MSLTKTDVAAILKRVSIKCNLSHIQTLTSSVTTAWGVDWDEEYIARDLMQNFFDANRQNLDEVSVRKSGSDVVVTAPAPLNLERLFYLGSEKGEGDVGQYGEGFKVAATCLLRDHSVTPIAASGNEVVSLRVSEQSVSGTQLHPVEYDFYSNKNTVDGTLLILPNCAPKLAKAVAAGLTHFFYPNNPLLGTKCWSDYSGEFSLYESRTKNGHVFYGNLKRGQIEGIPVILVINKRYKQIENRISKDRDRNAFGDDVMKMFYNHFARFGLKHDDNGQLIVVQAARPNWERGHPLLSELAGTRRHRSVWRQESVKRVFQDKFFSRSLLAGVDSNRMEITQLEKAWCDVGKIPLPSYFSKFGVLNANDEIARQLDQANKEAVKENRRRPTTSEQAAIDLLFSILKQLAPEIVAVLENGAVAYTVVKAEAMLGAFRSGRSYRAREVFIAERIFASDFSEALAVFLHEHSHIFGHDGSRGFTDALTGLLETVVRFRKKLDEYNDEWTKIRQSINRERAKKQSKQSENLDVENWIANLGEEELRDTLSMLPVIVLHGLRENVMKKKES